MISVYNYENENHSVDIKADNLKERRSKSDIIIVIILFLFSFNSSNHVKIFLRSIYFIMFFLNLNLFFLSFKKERILLTTTKFILQNIFIYFFIIYINPFYNLLFFWLPFPQFFKALNIILFSCYFSLDIFSNEDKINLNLFKQIYLMRILEFLIHSWKRFLKIMAFLIFIKISLFVMDDKFSHLLINKSSITNQKYFIAANLFNNEDILPNWTKQLKELINYLGPSNCYISIVENGDSTDDTPHLLSQLKIELTEMNINNNIITHKIIEKSNYKRIEFLAKIRNLAMEYIYVIPNLDFSKTKIIFLNDIIYSYTDILKLLTTNDQNYDLVCGMDFYGSFYDFWVTRGIDGMIMGNHFPYLKNKVAADRIVNGENLRVSSCWNGAVVMKAEPFENRKLYFRAPKRYKLSECMILNMDMLNLGYGIVVMNPNVKFTYTYFYYYMNKYVYPWTKDVFTYFYYFFCSMKVENDYNYENLVDNSLKLPSNWEDMIRKYFSK